MILWFDCTIITTIVIASRSLLCSLVPWLLAWFTQLFHQIAMISTINSIIIVMILLSLLWFPRLSPLGVSGSVYTFFSIHRKKKLPRNVWRKRGGGAPPQNVGKTPTVAVALQHLRQNMWLPVNLFCFFECICSFSCLLSLQRSQRSRLLGASAALGPKNLL